MIMLKDILLRKGKRELLNIPDLKIPGGKITVVLGPNGAGKSTLLKVLSGSITADQGEVLLFGLKISEWSARKLAQSRAMLSQHYNLPFSMPVRELVALGRYPHSVSGREAAIVQEIMEEMQLIPLENRNVQTLSGGEQQRTHMARVLLQLKDDEDERPKLLLLDEPVSSLDIVHQQTILKMARKCANKGYTVVMVLHDLNLAIQYADHFLILKKGQLIASTPTLNPEILSDLFDIPMYRLEDASQSRHYYFASDAR
ncbi:MAG: heme ABC transporter ATP-binding protein [Proteobacteria bacterium]|nr:MAG: heme ABC transporter ATP-binding protein [Pseudomonadota bacterium]